MADLQSAAVDAANQAGVDPDFFTSLIGNGEGGFANPNGVSPAGARGPAQLMPATAASVGVQDINDPIQNLQGGARYVRQLQDKYGDQTLVAAAYNAGPGAVDRHGGVPPFPETQAYVQRVMGGVSGPSQADLQAAFNASQSGPQAASPGSSAPGGATTPQIAPTGSAGPSDGTRGVYAQRDGSVVDPATGIAYQPDTRAGPGFYRDPNGRQFQVTTPEPSQDDLQKAFDATPAGKAGSSPPVAPDTAPTFGSVAGQGARGLLDTLSGSANQIINNVLPNPAHMLSAFGDATDYLGGLIRTATGDGPPQKPPTFNPFTAGSAGDIDTAAAARPWLSQQPQNFPERAARTVGRLSAGAASGPEGEAGIIPQLLSRGANVVGPSLGSIGASEATRALGGDQGAQDLAGNIGAGVGGIATLGPRAISIAARNVVDPFAARFSQGAAQTQAGRYIAGQASDLPAVRASLANGPDVTVPGSVPTTFQQTGDMGLGALERGVAAKNPAPFQQRAADQNLARVDALGSLQSGGDPQAVATHIRGTLDALDAQTQAHVDGLTQAAQAKAQAIGGNVTPEDAGETIRGIVNTAEQGARTRESGLWQAVDPNGDLTGNTAATSQAAKDISGSIPTTAKPMQGEEAGIFDAAQSMPHLSPVSDLIALRSRLSTEMRNELIANGRSPAYARMSQLRGAMQDNLANSVSDAVQSQPAVLGRLGAWLDAEQQFRALTNVGGGSAGATAASGSPPLRGALGTAGVAGGGPGDVAGTPGIPGAPQFSPPRLGAATASTAPASGPPGWSVGPQASAPQLSPLEAVAGPSAPPPAAPPRLAAGGPPEGIPGNPPQLTPTFDSAAAGRLADATAATRARAATFGQQPIAGVTAKAGDATQFRLPDGRVPGRFFHPGPSGYTDMQSLLSASPEAAQPIQDYAASTLRRAAMNDDGTLDPAKFSKWQAQHTDALRALPAEARARFADAASANQAVGDAAVNRASQLKAAQTGAIGKMMGAQSPEEVTSRIGNVLNGPTRVSDMQTLANATAGNADARAGLRQAVADHITSKFVGNTEAGTSGVGTMKADPFQSFMRQSKPALAKVFSPAEIDGMQAIADDMARSKRSQTALKLPGGSNTVQDAHASGLATGGMAHGVGRVVMDIITAGIGEHLIPHFGSEIGLASGEMINALRSQGIGRVNDLVTRGLLDPTVARALLQRVPAGAKLTASSMQGRTLIRALGGPAVAMGAQSRPGAPWRPDPSLSAPRLRPAA